MLSLCLCLAISCVNTGLLEDLALVELASLVVGALPLPVVVHKLHGRGVLSKIPLVGLLHYLPRGRGGLGLEGVSKEKMGRKRKGYHDFKKKIEGLTTVNIFSGCMKNYLDP